MQISATYRSLWNIGYPIMVGSLAQNLIGLTDIIFLGRVGEVELGAAGFMAIYYLVLVMMGFGISRGGQILIARRAGEGNYGDIGLIVSNLFYVEMFAAGIFFLFMQFISPFVLHWFIASPKVYDASIDYLFYRSFGIFFSLFGFTLMALYTGIGRTRVIAIIMGVLFVVNLVLNYVLVFGKCGFPQMGIGGSGLASSLAEIASSVVGLVWLFYDKKLRAYHITHLYPLKLPIIKQLAALSSAMIAQYLISFGGWFVLFSFIENMGERALAVSSVLRNVYNLFGIPSWGMASAANAVVSNLIGQNKVKQVFIAIYRTAIISFVLTIVACLFLVILPDPIIHLFTDDPAVAAQTKIILFLLIGIILTSSISVIIFNSLMGTGSIGLALLIETGTVITYLTYAYVVSRVLHLGLEHLWAAEFVYWVVLAVPSLLYLQSARWRRLRV